MENFDLWYRKNRTKFASGNPPLTFQSTGQPINNWAIYGHTSLNLFDISSIIPDSSIDFQTGEIVESDGTSVSAWIPVSDTGLFFSGMLTSSDLTASLVVFALYDGEKNLLDIQVIGWNEVGAKSHEITIVERTAFLRLQLTDNIYQDVMINQGETALPYEPFGAVGERTENLWNGNYVRGRLSTTARVYNTGQNTSVVIPCEPNTVYTVRKIGESDRFSMATSTTYPRDGMSVTPLYTSSSTVTVRTFTTPSDAAYIIVFLHTTTSTSVKVNVFTGATAPSEYVPYGYKIPITCGGETTNIYIGDTPLGTEQTVTGIETGVAIPTGDGQNTLSVETTVQPSKVVISAASGMTESVKRYFDYKYGVLKMAGVKE